MDQYQTMLSLITGGTGFLAEELITRIPGKIRVVARNEGKLLLLQQKYPEIETICGDIADPFICHKAMDGVDFVYHTAAFKYVGLAQEQVYQCVRSNVIGTCSMLQETLVSRPKVFVYISTDKAAQIRGVYGATKYLGEHLIHEIEKLNPDTQYRIVRYGNILWSTGSFLGIWKHKMQKGEPIKMTSPEATRFFWTREEAVDLIFDCVKNAKDSTPHIPTMKSISMGVMAEACMELWGKVDVKIIGLKDGENLHETMDGKIYSDKVEQFTKDEVMEKILLEKSS